MGTTYVARDINSIVEALGEDALIRYWGLSYGTILGSTLAAMFPEKIDRMVLDGNINPTEFYHGTYDESVAGADPALDYIFRQCFQGGPKNCSFARFGGSAQELLDTFSNILIAARDEEAVRSKLYDALKYPLGNNNDFTFFAAAEWLSGLYEGPNNSEVITRLSRRTEDTTKGTTMAIHAVNCGDWDDIPGTTEDWTEWLGQYQNRSAFAGDLRSGIDIIYQCSAWQLNARGKYNGNFTNIQTKTPILFVNGPYDPATPMQSAQNASAGFIGSKVLEHRGPGHCSPASPSNCTRTAVRQYWLTGEMPDVSKPCEPDFPPLGFTRPADTEDSNLERTRLRRRDGGFEYPEIPYEVAQMNESLFDRLAGCTPVDADKSDDSVLSAQQFAKGLVDFRAACSGSKSDSWLFKLMCSAIG